MSIAIIDLMIIILRDIRVKIAVFKNKIKNKIYFIL